MPDKSSSNTTRKLLRRARKVYVFFHGLLFALILMMAGALFVVFRPDGLGLINRYLLEPMGIHYSRSEGSLVEGFTLYDVTDGKRSAQKLTLSYNLASMLKGRHVVDRVSISGLRIDLDDFTGGSDTPWPLPKFQLKEVELTNLQLLSAYPIELDVHAKNGSYDGENLNFAAVDATVKSLYAGAAVRGAIRNNALSGNALLYPDHRTLAPYSGRFTDLPRSIAVQIRELSDTKALLHATVQSLRLKQDPTLHADAIDLDFDYRYDNDYFDVQSLYRLIRGNESMQTRQSLRYTFEGTTAIHLEGEVQSSLPLPSKTLRADITDTPAGVSGTALMDGTTLSFASSDYSRFHWDVQSQHESLSFLPMLPALLQHSPFTFEAKGEYDLDTNFITGNTSFTHNHGRFEGKFAYGDTNQSLEGILNLPEDAPMWKEWRHKPPQTLHVSLIQENNTSSVWLTGDAVELSLYQAGKALKGSGHYAGVSIDFQGFSEPGRSELVIDTHDPSVWATLKTLSPMTLYNGEYYDAEVSAKTRLTLTDTLSFHSDVTIPWYAAVMDSQRAYGGTDGSFSLDYRDGNVTINRYRFEIAGHSVYSDNPSQLALLDDGTVAIKRFRIYDSLFLNGSVLPDTSMHLRLQSDRFTYEGPEGKAQAAADITFERDAQANHTLSGELTILDALITYLPIQQFKVMDDDIIIVQDVRPPSSLKFAMNLHILSRRPIAYQTKELSVRITPDLTLWKEPQGPMQILGMVTIPSGTATSAGKQFDIKHSEIYFGGDIPLNPYLDLTVAHEVDYKKFLIYITHTLESPIFLFSSDPVMSQNDIMSYILFGAPANSSTTTTSTTTGTTGTATVRADATNFMLGAGLKGLISGVTKIQLDTMNILTNQQGGMGFEVGTRLNKDLRILYKNDTLSSVLVQYQLNRWLRLDADIHALGQGINAVYIKDFRDFLPHNDPKAP